MPRPNKSKAQPPFHDQYLKHLYLVRDRITSLSEYPFNLPAISKLERLEFHPALTFFVGENGAGKSTLLEALAISLGFNPEGGTKNFQFKTRESHSLLHEKLRVARGISRPKDGFFLRAESFFNVATELERLDSEPGGPPLIPMYGGRSLHEQSHGESFLALLAHRFRGQGLYILDEPEAALSPQRQLAAISRIHDLIEQGSQFVIATHSPILMAYPHASIYSFSEDGISKISYEETDHYKIMRRFMADPLKMLNMLFRSE